MATSAHADKPQLPQWEVGNEPKFIAEVAELLKDSNVPCILVGPAYHRVLGIRGGIETVSFAIDGNHLKKAREALEVAGLSRQCRDEGTCCYSQPSFRFRVPKPNDLFHIERFQDGEKHPEIGHISLYKREKWLPRLSSIPVSPPESDDLDYLLASDERLPFACEEHRRACRDNDKVNATKCVCDKKGENYTCGRYPKSLPGVMILRPARLVETWVSAEVNQWLLEYHRDIELCGDQGRFWDALYSFPDYSLWKFDAFATEFQLWWVMVRLTVGYVRGLSVPQLDPEGCRDRDVPEETFPRGLFPKEAIPPGFLPQNILELENFENEDSTEDEDRTSSGMKPQKKATAADISFRRREQLRIIRQDMLIELDCRRMMHPIKGVSPV
ncbi:hypothetical protein BO83DRAFT_399531 [Aspergillus eucalypticola CBS 122712]|uniref:Uncharacterized protein n=1 Tax=Aspergillus eucalypticola (strain CBS 122712 / IBT 29274) TaxID=1448314 RepID=A0A317VD89_ASPEC|nr:uncharacterized protein BO83DRAFT_399531 [Aspergillus eucalypticola CBS 122712]PWY71231.1 hypothetical protein BO83DRAFT_399531 [Aspergillus eucalypticola CBS 122712]